MSSKMNMFTRREFLRSAAIVSAGATMPFFLSRAVTAQLGEEPEARSIPGFKDDRVLVVVQLGGGNDGLNTIVPIGDDAYHQNRNQLRLDAKSLIKVDDYVSFHSGLAGLKGLLDEGVLSVINGVGYPNPNRSHFRSMEIWQTGSDSDRLSDTGWIGRYFDNACNGTPKPETVAGLHIGQELPQAFDGENGIGVSFQDPSQFKWREGKGWDRENVFRRLNKTNDSHAEDGDSIDYLRHITSNVALSSDQVTLAGARTRKSGTYPNTKLGRDLKVVANLIAAELPTRIYYVSISGFDTHANQIGAHQRLMQELNGALVAFQRDLKSSKLDQRVMTLCFSEFGRRVKENYSRGTDHGTAGPMFLMGPTVKGGLQGSYPSLTDLDSGDLKYSVDFRDVYATLLQRWFGSDPAQVLGKGRKTLDILQI